MAALQEVEGLFLLAEWLAVLEYVALIPSNQFMCCFAISQTSCCRKSSHCRPWLERHKGVQVQICLLDDVQLSVTNSVVVGRGWKGIKVSRSESACLMMS